MLFIELVFQIVQSNQIILLCAKLPDNFCWRSKVSKGPHLQFLHAFNIFNALIGIPACLPGRQVRKIALTRGEQKFEKH